jgi:flagellar motor switch protein FliN
VTSYIDCWISVAKTLFAQALAGEPEFSETQLEYSGAGGPVFGFAVTLKGSVSGQFTIVLDPAILVVPLAGGGVDQKSAWGELLREVADAAAGELLAKTGKKCEVAGLIGTMNDVQPTRAFRLKSPSGTWRILVRDEVRDEVLDSLHDPLPESGVEGVKPRAPNDAAFPFAVSQGVELLLDVELEAAIRFGCREMSLGEVLELGPGDVVELDRHVADPVDLVVGDKIVARGDVVLVNGSFGLRVTEVAAPRKRLESIRCLF